MGHFNFLSTLRVATETSQGMNDCCLHNDFRWSDTDSGSDVESEDSQPLMDSIEDYGSQILSLLKLMEPGTLRGFHWDLGTCVPDSLLGKSGYLLIYQRNIEYLSLATDGSCLRSARKGLPGLHVRNFKSLRGVSWKGLQNYSELNTLRLLLDINAPHLTSLELEILECQYYQSLLEVEISGSIRNLLSSPILALPFPDMRLQFPSLRSLSLTGLPLECTDVDVKELISALNISGLRKLRLLGCRSVLSFPQAIQEMVTKLQLESFELALLDKLEDDISFQNTLSSCLASFRGLRDFRLFSDLFHRPLAISSAIDCHRTTLRQLVLHDRRSLSRNLNVAVERSALYDMFNDECQYPGQFPGLEGVGLGTNCSLKELFQMGDLGFLDNVKLLHLRGTRKDRENEGFIVYNLLGIDRNQTLEMLSNDAKEFARWVFGPTRLPKLRVLACGDPHCDDIQLGNWIASRATPSANEPELFRWTSLAEREELTGIANSFEMLSACRSRCDKLCD